MADVLDVLSIYWPFMLAVLAIGIVIGWWAEAVRAAAHARLPIEHEPDA